jgi:hypothetical protein
LEFRAEVEEFVVALLVFRGDNGERSGEALLDGVSAGSAFARSGSWAGGLARIFAIDFGASAGLVEKRAEHGERPPVFMEEGR